MNKNGDNYDIDEIDEDFYTNKITIPDIYLEEFNNNLSIERIKFLYQKLKLYEVKGYVNYDKYFESMKQTFDESMKNKMYKLSEEKKIENNFFTREKSIDECIDEIYELYFNRFREVKCLIKNDKTVFYLTDYKPENFINTYNLTCSLTIFLKSSFINKIKLLFDLTDIDEDGFLNEEEIRNMITTSNFLFCEESNRINTNSSILSQSLMNLKVNDILKKILYEPGNLYFVLEEEKYINFDMLYKSIIKIKDYKYYLLPSFIDFKKCLQNVKKEKFIKVEDKFKKDFINICSSLFKQKSFYMNKSPSTPYLGNIIKPKKISDKENEKYYFNNKNDLPNINKNFFLQRKNTLKKKLSNNYSYKNINYKNDKITETPNILHNSNRKSLMEIDSLSSRNIKKSIKKFIFEKRKTLKDLLKETTIIDSNDDKNKKDNSMKHFNRSNYYNQEKKEAKYIFEAYYDKIRNMEVKPGLIQFIGGYLDKEKYPEKEINLGLRKSLSESNKLFNNAIINTNIKDFNINNNHYSNKSPRKNSEDKNGKNLNKILTYSEKSKKGSNNELQNSIIKEEKSTEEKEDDNNQKERKSKYYKIINSHIKLAKSTKKLNNLYNYIPITVKRDTKKNLTGFKLIPSEKAGRVRNFSFHKKASIFFKKKLVPYEPKNEDKLKKSLLDTNLKEGFKYKTLEEVYKEMANQENKLGLEAYGGYGLALVRLSNNLLEEQNELKKMMGHGDIISLGPGYLKRFLQKKKDGNKEQNV